MYTYREKQIFLPDNKKTEVEKSIFIKLWFFRLKIKPLQEDGRCLAKEMCLRGRALNDQLDGMREEI